MKIEAIKDHRAIAGYDNEPDSRYRLMNEEIPGTNAP